ncbi:hypothetical protein M433DRAFT_133358 [Acidomyces richmondensis BFW]|nr:hypothetical protein M433DRAFT_133358 [Acidomyces richmondensis BFW]
MPVMIVYCHTIEVRVSWSCLSAHIVPDPKEAAGAAEGEARVYAMPPFYVEKDMGTLEPQPYLPRPSGGIAMEESCLRTPKRANEQNPGESSFLTIHFSIPFEVVTDGKPAFTMTGLYVNSYQMSSDFMVELVATNSTFSQCLENFPTAYGRISGATLHSHSLRE